MGKEYAGQVAKASSKAAALKLREEGFAALQAVFEKQAGHLEALKTVAMALRRLPVVDTGYPTVSLPSWVPGDHGAREGIPCNIAGVGRCLCTGEQTARGGSDDPTGGAARITPLAAPRVTRGEDDQAVPVTICQPPPLAAQVVLVGAPNVGKSSLVQALSSGVPEVCDYPFTTRTIHMGHFFVDGARHQVTPLSGPRAHAGHPRARQAGLPAASSRLLCRAQSTAAAPLGSILAEQADTERAAQVSDTPGLLNRPEAERNTMEQLTLACLQHLPCAVVFVVDLTALCGTAVPDQLAIRAELLARFPHKTWLDVLSKVRCRRACACATRGALGATGRMWRRPTCWRRTRPADPGCRAGTTGEPLTRGAQPGGRAAPRQRSSAGCAARSGCPAWPAPACPSCRRPCCSWCTARGGSSHTSPDLG